ncbi:MAG: YebC/PmpR family DNA-binding transcriptional regulator [Candidatus Saganbacteria bacterium]|nr:YebC/PmpR family DNA-binding transcriptional regulator [Candidatus Saganbacteria bacterium]
MFGHSKWSTIDEIAYEGDGPSGVAIMIEAMTDNKQRSGLASGGKRALETYQDEKTWKRCREKQ